MIRIAHILLAALALVGTTAAQDDGSTRKLAVRVVSSPARGTVVVDRGRNDRIEVGDPVDLLPRSGGTYAGTVVRVEERTSLVELADRDFVPPVGTRGEVRVPRSRGAPPPAAATQPPPAPPTSGATTQPTTTQPAESQAQESQPVWRNKDEGYTQDKPLLAAVRAVRPEERRTRLSGRAFLTVDVTRHPESDFDESFFRAGSDVRIDNPFGDGGTLRMYGEVNYRTEHDDDSGTNGVIHDLSYTWGGTRFAPLRWQVGRFLQYGMPEFGVVDGAEFNFRGQGGHNLGASMGFMPVPDDDFGGVDDFQLAVNYRWVSDEVETLMFGGGLQWTLHEGDNDRNLVVLKTRYAPADGWHFDAVAWVDFYDGADDVKSRSIDITQAVATLGRTWKSGNRLALNYRHLGFPELRRREFLPVPPNELVDDRNDKLGLDGWLYLSSDVRSHAYVAGWSDEEGTGGAAEAGLEIADFLGERTQTDLIGFGNTGEFGSVAGGRIDWSLDTSDGNWNVLYEYSYAHDSGFDSIAQHRLRVSRNLHSASGMDFSPYVEGLVWSNDLSWSAGFHLQQRF
ncbi:MAG: hypothetical protein IT458_20600 [Planctomycetes bacterium]|nr:hypothetical protein [Planctomycetota bacterium]